MTEEHDDEGHVTRPLDGQLSINDFLPVSPAIVPVAIREPTDEELAQFLANEPAAEEG